jgi:hypothetical protein
MGLMKLMRPMGRIGIICGLHSDNFINPFIAASFITEGRETFGFPEPKKSDFCDFFMQEKPN